MSTLAKAKVKDKAIQVHMAAVVAKPMDRAIMILRMEGIYRVLLSLAKDKEGRRQDKGSHSNSNRGSNIRASMEVQMLFLGGLIDGLEHSTIARVETSYGLELWNESNKDRYEAL